MFYNSLSFISKSIKGIKLIAVFDKDGFVVEKIENENKRSDEIAAEFSSVLRHLDKVTHFLTTGKMEKILMECENEKFYLHKLNQEYYMLVVMELSSLVGKLKYIIRMVESDLKKELE